ncbi:hypothetical protein HHI36_016267 [Cryptolaemus montrouzieri]|uniref:Diuretic hormone 31 n=1 Tax=Cryptolaemus montrouzieri TaxID=559131 RepID=A0ABD2NJ71_9CUCU
MLQIKLSAWPFSSFFTTHPSGCRKQQVLFRRGRMNTRLYNNNLALILILTISDVFVQMRPSEASSLLNSTTRDYLLRRQNPDPEYMMQVFTELRQAYTGLMDEDNWPHAKRGLDLGVGRGYSGSLAAKHRLGMAAASFAGGPGRRRRNERNA